MKRKKKKTHCSKYPEQSPSNTDARGDFEIKMTQRIPNQMYKHSGKMTITAGHYQLDLWWGGWSPCKTGQDSPKSQTKTQYPRVLQLTMQAMLYLWGPASKQFTEPSELYDLVGQWAALASKKLMPGSTWGGGGLGRSLQAKA